MKRIRRVLIGCLALLCPVAAWAQASHVALEITAGGVTLDARQATVREILSEWARVGGIRVVNVEKLDDAPMTLHLANVPEREAIDIVLRDVRGYVLGGRTAGSGGASQFGTLVLILANAPLFSENGQAPRLPSSTPTDEIEETPSLVAEADADDEKDPDERDPRGSAPAQGDTGAASVGFDPLEPLDVPPALRNENTEEAAALLRVTQPPTPIERPSEAPDAANPFGKVSGTDKAGAIAPSGPPPGFIYPAQTGGVVRPPSTEPGR